jgi:hypothetical protein
MAFRFEFDAVNKILLVRYEGLVTDKLLAESYEELRKYAKATDAHSSISDFSCITESDASSEFIRELARREPGMDATCPRFILVGRTVGFGLARMFQITGEPKRPLLQVVRTLDEALAVLGVQSPHFEPLE